MDLSIFLHHNSKGVLTELLDLIDSSAVNQGEILSFKKVCSILCTPSHYGEEKKAALLKMSGIKIHSTYIVFVFHEQSEKRAVSAQNLYCTIQNSVSHTAGTHGHMMLKTVLSG